MNLVRTVDLGLKPLCVHLFCVEGEHVFPFEMLPVENAVPNSPEDAMAMARSGRRTVTLRAYRTVRGEFVPHAGWTRHGWKPVELLRDLRRAPTEIEMHRVKSSNIHSIGYEADRKALRVRFLDPRGNPGALYEYVGVPADVYGRLRIAAATNGSVGKILHADVRDRYVCMRIS